MAQTSIQNIQTDPRGAIPSWDAGGNFTNVNTSTLTQIKTGVGCLQKLTTATIGTGSAASFYDGTSSIATISIATPAVISWPNHGLVAGNTVRFTTTGALPTGLVVGTTYFVLAAGLTPNTFQLSATLNGAAINTSGTQSGVHTAWNNTNLIGTFTTTVQNSLNIGARLSLGLIAITTDGGLAANLVVTYL